MDEYIDDLLKEVTRRLAQEFLLEITPLELADWLGFNEEDADEYGGQDWLEHALVNPEGLVDMYKLWKMSRGLEQYFSAGGGEEGEDIADLIEGLTDEKIREIYNEIFRRKNDADE